VGVPTGNEERFAATEKHIPVDEVLKNLRVCRQAVNWLVRRMQRWRSGGWESRRTLLRAWPMWRLPLAYGGPSCSVKGAPEARWRQRWYVLRWAHHACIAGSRETALARKGNSVEGRFTVLLYGDSSASFFLLPPPLLPREEHACIKRGRPVRRLMQRARTDRALLAACSARMAGGARRRAAEFARRKLERKPNALLHGERVHSIDRRSDDCGKRCAPPITASSAKPRELSFWFHVP
jgi:hypothetical protein